MRIGVFGGTFDPVHLGHLILAEQCREQARLDRVLFVPAFRPPHKQDQEVTPFAQRVEMLSLAIAGNPAFAIDELEAKRAGLSYTVETLEELRRRAPDVAWFLLVGSDTLPDMAGWHSPARIAELAEIILVARPGYQVEDLAQLPGRLKLPPHLRVHQLVHVPMVDFASRDLRRRIAEGRSVRYLVPRAVESYIATHHLYQ